MAKLPRVTNKLYGSEIELEDIGQFGSAKSGNKVNTKDIPTIQGDEAWKKGWTHATMSSNKYPTRQERNGMDYSFSYQIDYLLREGLPEYDAGTEYNKGSMVKQLNSQNKIVLYQSLIDNNIGLDLENPNAWQEVYFSSGSLDVCDIGMALYVDESKGLRRYLNGQIVTINSNTKAFGNRLEQIKALHPSLFCSNSDWEAAKTASVYGQVGRFVLNYADDGETVESVRLPRVVNVQGLFDMANLGATVKAGLPTHTHTRGSMNITGAVGCIHDIAPDASGAFTYINDNVNKSGIDTAGNVKSLLNFDASRSWTGSTSTGNYSKSLATTNTVQPEAIQYPYFIQIATGTETENNIVNDIELNNPFSFGDSKYSPIELNNISWLKSSGQWNSKAVYPDFYNWVLENVNKGENGFKTTTAYAFDDTGDTGYYWWISTATPQLGMTVYVHLNNVMQKTGVVDRLVDNGFVFTDKENVTYTVTRNQAHDIIGKSTNWITDYDFVINTADETFRLPIKNGQEGMFSTGASQAVVGTGNALGLYNGDSNGNVMALYAYDNTRAFVPSDKTNPLAAGSSATIGSPVLNIAWGVSTNASKSGLKTVGSTPVVPSGWNLYYYVGETVQNANLIDAGRIAEDIVDLYSTKTDKVQAANASMPSDKFINLTLGASGSSYIAPADGWVKFAFWDITKVGYINLLARMDMQNTISYTGGSVNVYIPVSKGETFKCYYDVTGTSRLRFYYAQGSVPTA